MKKNITFLAFMLIPVTAKADLLTGVLNITGTANLSTGTIAFGATHQFSINSPASSQQGSFTSLAGTTGTIDDITNPTGGVNIPDFMTFNSAPNITITLRFLYPGIEGSAGCTDTPPAAGDVCTPAQSPFDFFNTSPLTGTATFNIEGLETDSSTAATVFLTGVFSIPLNESFQQLLSTIQGGGTVTSSFSGSLATESSPPPPPPSVPEPNTWTSLATGAAGLFLFRLLRQPA